MAEQFLRKPNFKLWHPTLLCFLVLLAAPSEKLCAAGDEYKGYLPPVVGFPYTLARRRLIFDRNIPLPVPITQHKNCVGADDVCAAYPETEYCQGTGDRECSFRWKDRSGHLFMVMTTGEIFNLIRVAVFSVDLRKLHAQKAL